MKAGTTSLAAWLRAHPSVHMAAQKEVHFFDASWRRGVDWYRSQFPTTRTPTIAGEATTEYMVHRAYIERMASVVPGTRLIVMLRDPVDRAWSQYNHSVQRGDEQRPFPEALDAEESFDHDDWRACGMCLARGRYVEHLRNLHDCFAANQIHVGRFDDLVASPEEFFGAVCRFLGIDDTVRPENLGTNYNPRAVDIGAKASRQRRNTTGWTELLTMAPEMRARSDNPTLPPDVRARLVDYFRPYNEALASEFGVDVAAWDVYDLR